MIDIPVPTEHASRGRGRAAEPQRRLMAAVLQAVVDDCRGGSVHRRTRGHRRLAARSIRRAIAYVASSDRGWPFSFENLCDALGLDADGLREELGRQSRSGPVAIRSVGSCKKTECSKPSAEESAAHEQASGRVRLRVEST